MGAMKRRNMLNDTSSNMESHPLIGSGAAAGHDPVHTDSLVTEGSQETHIFFSLGQFTVHSSRRRVVHGLHLRNLRLQTYQAETSRIGQARHPDRYEVLRRLSLGFAQGC